MKLTSIILITLCVCSAFTLKCSASGLVSAFNSFRRNPPAMKGHIQSETGDKAGWNGDGNCFTEAKNEAVKQRALPAYRTETGAIKAAKMIADLQAQHKQAGHTVAGSTTTDRVNKCMKKSGTGSDYREMISSWSAGKSCQHVVNQYYVDAFVSSRSHRKAMIMANLDLIGTGVTANGSAEYTGVIFSHGYVDKSSSGGSSSPSKPSTPRKPTTPRKTSTPSKPKTNSYRKPKTNSYNKPKTNSYNSRSRNNRYSRNNRNRYSRYGRRY